MVEFQNFLLRWQSLLAAGVAGFLGAFLAFLIGRIEVRIDRNRKRWARHRNGLVRLERQLNEIIPTAYDNKYIADTFLKAYPRSEVDTPIMWKEPHSIPFDSSLGQDFLRLEITNNLFSLGVRIQKLNSDIRTVVRA